jgi:hypothetical protein
MAQPSVEKPGVTFQLPCPALTTAVASVGIYAAGADKPLFGVQAPLITSQQYDDVVHCWSGGQKSEILCTEKSEKPSASNQLALLLARVSPRRTRMRN